jgi:hypothetical protein
LVNILNFLQTNGSSEPVTKPTDVLSKTNGSEGANKEGKHYADLLLIFYVIT